MDLVRCQNNHFYDSDKYDKCPHCERTGKEAKKEKTQEEESNNLYISESEENELKREDDFSKKERRTDEVNYNECELTEADDMGKTMKYYDTDVVVGWLVAIEGNHKGESFNLKAGKNYVGRGTDMDVCLIKDQSVSRNKHVTVIFDAVNSEFIIYMGESKELVYVNDELLLSNNKLEDRDRIRIGKTVLVFVPFCNNMFSWKE